MIMAQKKQQSWLHRVDFLSEDQYLWELKSLVKSLPELSDLYGKAKNRLSSVESYIKYMTPNEQEEFNKLS